jgi:beta-barrel assembly-enhancing protease
MRYTIQAGYFDGLSSASKEIILEYNDDFNDFRLRIANGNSFLWYSEDLYFERYGSLIEIRNKNFSGAILKINDETFANSFYKSMRQNKRIDIHARLLNLSLPKIVGIAVCLLGIILLSYFFILPPVAEKSAILLPESFDTEVGTIFMKTFLDENKIDSIKSKYLEQFAAELDLKNKKPLRFSVVNSSQVNAFASPNGQIIVYSAILDEMNGPDELAALLGHEASHINNRHSIKLLCRNLAGYMIVSLLLSDVNGIMAVIADNAQQIHSLSYSRHFEEEADEQGLKILIDNNINPFGMVNLFEQLEEETDFAIPEIMSSHPLTKERKSNMKKIIAKHRYKIKPNDNLKIIFEQLKS